jgi:hypothetical protein
LGLQELQLLIAELQGDELRLSAGENSIVVVLTIKVHYRTLHRFNDRSWVNVITIDMPYSI